MPIFTDEERLGTTLADKYELSRILGSGGMGTVFLARHRWTGRRVAVKLLKPALATDALVRERFLREARAAASLEHPNAVDVLDMGQTEDGTVFLVLELLDGRTLADLLLERKTLTEAETFSVMLPVIDALEAAHTQGFLHRDVKPENIFLTPGPDDTVVPKLLDFGLAKALDAASGGANGAQTATGHVLGTPYYMSPEQAAGKRDLAPASDVWSVGVVLFECLAGSLPFVGNSLTAVLLAIVGGRAPPLRARAPGVRPEVAAIVDRTLVPELEARVPTMRALATELREVGVLPRTESGRLMALRPSGLGIEMPPTRLVESAPTVGDRHRRAPVAAIAAVAILALLGLAGGGWVIAAALGAFPIDDAVDPTPPSASQARVTPVEVEPAATEAAAPSALEPAGERPPDPEAAPDAEAAAHPTARTRPATRPATRRGASTGAVGRASDVSIRTDWEEGHTPTNARGTGASDRPDVQPW